MLPSLWGEAGPWKRRSGSHFPPGTGTNFTGMSLGLLHTAPLGVPCACPATVAVPLLCTALLSSWRPLRVSPLCCRMHSLLSLCSTSPFQMGRMALPSPRRAGLPLPVEHHTQLLSVQVTAKGRRALTQHRSHGKHSAPSLPVPSSSRAPALCPRGISSDNSLQFP